VDNRYRDLFARHILSLLGLSEQVSPQSAIITRGGFVLGQGFSKSTGTEYKTSPIFEALYGYYARRNCWDPLESYSSLFCSYFPTFEEFIALYSSDIRTVYYMGDITEEKTVRFLNSCSGLSFEIIKLEVEK
jgi:hypothetical protein